jgi:protein SCO1/2
MDKKFFWIGTGILVLVVLAAGTALILQKAPVTFHGSVLNPPAQAADFSLTDQSGGTIRLSDYRGKYVLLFFGYSHCLDQCPATMAILARARSLLGSRAGQVQVIFVATDPAHDTPQSMGEFVSRFDPTFMGATGTFDQLQPIWTAYGVTVADGGETHSSYTYLVDPQGDLRLTYAYPGNPDEIAADLQTLFKGK